MTQREYIALYALMTREAPLNAEELDLMQALEERYEEKHGDFPTESYLCLKAFPLRIGEQFSFIDKGDRLGTTGTVKDVEEKESEIRILLEHPVHAWEGEGHPAPTETRWYPFSKGPQCGFLALGPRHQKETSPR